MITIEQLLESVNYQIEPKWVTKDKDGTICIFGCDKPKIARNSDFWTREEPCITIHHIKLADFENKDWQECIYEVPRKTDEYEQNLEKLRPADSDLVYRVKLPRKTTGKIEKLACYELADEKFNPTGKFEPMCYMELIKKINELVDAINKHTDIIQQIGTWGSSKGECLWCETLTSFEPNGFNKKEA